MVIAAGSSSVKDGAMLHLKEIDSTRWLAQVDENLDEVLIDHAHCERKAATTAMGLIGAYALDRPLCREMTRIIAEEMEHYEMVLDILDRRGITFRRLGAPPYGKRMGELVRSDEPNRAVDRLLVASLIEARSCQRFRTLADHIRPRDGELADFYAGLFESEARHHTTYVQLAEHYADRETVFERLDQLSASEAKILSEGYSNPRMHS